MLKCFKLIGVKSVKVKGCTVILKIIFFFKVIKTIKVFCSRNPTSCIVYWLGF